MSYMQAEAAAALTHGQQPHSLASASALRDHRAERGMAADSCPAPESMLSAGAAGKSCGTRCSAVSTRRGWLAARQRSNPRHEAAAALAAGIPADASCMSVEVAEPATSSQVTLVPDPTRST